MPNARTVQTLYITTGNPDTLNDSTLYREGELGMALDYVDRSYQLVRCDSGAVAAAAGAVAANQLAFWKDKNSYLVTNDGAQAIGGQTANAWRNQVAGVFRYAVTAGNYCFILQRGDNYPVKSDGNGGVGQSAIANSGSSQDVTNIAVGSSLTYQEVGVMRGAASGGNINVDLRITPIP